MDTKAVDHLMYGPSLAGLYRMDFYSACNPLLLTVDEFMALLKEC